MLCGQGVCKWYVIFYLLFVADYCKLFVKLDKGGSLMFYTYPIPTEQDKLGQLYMILLVLTFLCWAGDGSFLFKLFTIGLWGAAIILTCRYFNVI